jgi:hypothetical protein
MSDSARLSATLLATSALALDVRTQATWLETDAPRVARSPSENGVVSKTVVGLSVHRGFESLPLRFSGQDSVAEQGFCWPRSRLARRLGWVNEGQSNPAFPTFRSPDVPPSVARGTGTSHAQTPPMVRGSASTLPDQSDVGFRAVSSDFCCHRGPRRVVVCGRFPPSFTTACIIRAVWNASLRASAARG